MLLASADVNNDGVLDLWEFHDFIYSTNDALDVDLSKIPVSAKGEEA